jgi:uncharacterized protein DUF6777
MALTRLYVRLAALLAVAALLASCGGSGSAKKSTGVKGASEVMAEPVSSAGDNPFTAPVGDDMTGVKPPAAASMPTGGPASYRGGLPGLYGGTRNYATCNAHKLISFLEKNPDKALAWADTLKIPVSEIRRYINRLTPVILRTDTRVTNHGYVNGRATPLQSVLQAGTAVFVNKYGEPVVKCYCGNPLKPPTRYTSPTYIGPRWSGFGSDHITIINQNITIIKNYTLYDLRTGKTFVRPAGTSGESDTAAGKAGPSTGTGMMPPPDQTTPPSPPQQQSENPAAYFSPNPGQQGDTFILSVSGFMPGAHLDVTLTRPDGHVEHYPIGVGGDSRGSYTFTNTENVITGTYNAVVTNPETGATAHASLNVYPSGGGGDGGSGSGGG